MMTQNRLKELLLYNPQSGVFEWLKSGSGRKKKVAGRTESNGYISIGIDGRVYGAHRLAWLYVHGKLPLMIDHRNRVRNDNSIGNLRLTNYSKNALNCKPRINNKLKTLGVRETKYGKFTATFIRVHLGTFDTLTEAKEAREIYEKAYKIRIKYDN